MAVLMLSVTVGAAAFAHTGVLRAEFWMLMTRWEGRKGTCVFRVLPAVTVMSNPRLRPREEHAVGSANIGIRARTDVESKLDEKYIQPGLSARCIRCLKCDAVSKTK